MKKSKKISRRNFLLKGAATAAVTLAASVSEALAKKSPKKKVPPATAPPPPPPEEPPVTLSSVELALTVNGKKHVLTVPAGRTLAEVLRDDLGLTGVKIGCGTADCGACTVLVNGRPHYSCMLLATLANHGLIETVEGLSARRGGLHPIQTAFIEKDALQCGFCTPGMICSTKALLIRNPRPSRDEIREGLSGNLCRCGAYHRIIEAVERAAENI